MQIGNMPDYDVWYPEIKSHHRHVTYSKWVLIKCASSSGLRRLHSTYDDAVNWLEWTAMKNRTNSWHPVSSWISKEVMQTEQQWLEACSCSCVICGMIGRESVQPVLRWRVQLCVTVVSMDEEATSIGVYLAILHGLERLIIADCGLGRTFSDPILVDTIIKLSIDRFVCCVCHLLLWW